jgi:hypothetical protein
VRRLSRRKNAKEWGLQLISEDLALPRSRLFISSNFYNGLTKCLDGLRVESNQKAKGLMYSHGTADPIVRS